MVHPRQLLGEKYEQGPSPTFAKKSFAEILGGKNISSMVLQEKKAVSFRGEPAVMLNDQELIDLCTPLKLALIGSFSHSRPTMQQIKDFFVARGFKGSVEVGLLNQRQILIRPTLEEDYIRIWEKKLWNINSSIMRVVKWSPISHLMQESSIAPVWIAFPYLPVYCFDKSMLFALATAFGTPLKVDEPTANLTRPSVARVLVEVDVSKVHKERIWIGNEKEGFYQRVVFENMPKYCQFCYKMGHAVEDCYVKAPLLKEGQDDKAPKDNSKAVQSQKSEVIKKAPVAKPVQQKYVPKIGVIEPEKGKAAQSVSESQKTKTDGEMGTSNSIHIQTIDVRSNEEVDVRGDEGVCPGLTCAINTKVNSSNSLGSPGVVNLNSGTVNTSCTRDDRAPLSPSLAQAEREKVLTFSSAPPSPSKGTKSRPLATIRFAHSDDDSGDADTIEEDDEEEDEDIDDDPDYSPQMRNYDFYAYNSSKKGFRIGRLMGSSRR